MSWDCGLRYMFSVPPALQQQQPGGGVSGGGDKEDLSSRLEMVQRLAKDGCRFLHQSHSNSNNNKALDRTGGEGDEAVRVCSRERGRDVLVLRRVSSERRPAPPSSERRLNPSSSTRGGGGGGGGGRTADERQRRFTLVAGTPDKILDHLLSQLDLDGTTQQLRGTPTAEEPDTLLEDFLLTYLVFMSTSDLCHALLGHYVTKRRRGKEDGKDALDRKRKVLHLVSQWSALRRDFMRDDEHVKMFMKTLYRYVLDDLYQHPGLEQDVRELHTLIRLQRSHTTDEYSPNRKSKTPFHQLSPKENGLRSRGTQQRETKEVLCQVYVSMDSYMSMKVHAGVEAQEMILTLAERMDTPHQDLVLVAITYPGGRLLLQPHDRLYSDSLTPVGRLHVCRKHLSELAVSPVTDNWEQQQRTGRMLGMNTWDVAVALTNFDWTIFNSIHEQELVYFIFSRHAGSGHTAALEQLLQRCNEVQLWVATEVLLCPALCKRVQLIKKFIKIAAHCKAQKNLNCLFAIIMGLNTAAVSRLSLTWEKVPGKFKKLFSELETMTDPSLNHKAYRDSFKKMKAPKIPFLPLLLKDITFIHEGNKTFHDNLVNFEKLHMIADTVRLIRQCQTDHLGNGITEKSSADVSSYTDYLLIIDNQQTQFELSHRLEPRT